VVGWAVSGLPEDRPRHLLGIGEVDDLLWGVVAGIDTFDCAVPTRLARHGMALVPDPEGRWRVDLVKSRWREAREPVLEGCRCAACAGGFSRAYLRHLIRQGELTGMRLLTAHNLTFVADLMEDLRAALTAGELAVATEGIRRGEAPGSYRAARDAAPTRA
jgi:queuine tRNA-ribosyltransferase